MNINKKLRVWLELGVCRGARLAGYLSCSRQYVDSVSRESKGISKTKESEILIGMELVEQSEKLDQKKIEQNIVRCARLSHSDDSETGCYALTELDRWVEALGATA